MGEARYKKRKELVLKGEWDSSFPTSSSGWGRRLLKELKGYNCADCGIGEEYNGKPIVLEVNHIDGKSNNNTLDNLEFLCPNCHSQTDTYRAKNINSDRKKRYKIPSGYTIIKVE
jgi:5-methylcytosine-specific restriction endonuclease McrA